MYFFHREEDGVVETFGKSIKMSWEIWGTLGVPLNYWLSPRCSFPPVWRWLGSHPCVFQSSAFFIDPPEISGEVLCKKIMARLGLHAEWQTSKKLKVENQGMAFFQYTSY